MKKIKILSAFVCASFIFSNMTVAFADDRNSVETVVQTVEAENYSEDFPDYNLDKMTNDEYREYRLQLYKQERISESYEEFNQIAVLSEENEDLIQYVTPVDGTEDYDIYNEKKNFYELLSKYLKRTISKHPIEWDFNKIKQDKVCETRGKAPIDENKCCDIAADLRTADSKLFGENSFYFLCPPYFYNKMDELGLFEFNPYEKYNVTVPFLVKNNPGFMPKGITTDSFTQKFNKPYSSGYWHEGVDIAISKGTPIISGINGTVVFMDDKQNYSYGCFIIIQAKELYNGKCRYYLLGHLDRTKEYKKIGESVLPNEIVGYVGNTGHCGTSYVPKSEWNELDYSYGNGNLIANNHLNYRAQGYGAHLHLQMYLSSDLDEDVFVSKHKLQTSTAEQSIPLDNMEIVNPFNYMETYKNEK